MKLTEILNNDKVSISFEIFPPKAEQVYNSSVLSATNLIAKLRPSFISVTYGAGGSTQTNTENLSKVVQDIFNVPALTHLTCVGATKESITEYLEVLKKSKLENILALRGDLPKGVENPLIDFEHATDLVRFIKEFDSNFCLGGACYPEGHLEAPNKDEDIKHLKEKVEAGCDFLTTQMFFDNNIFYNFLYRVKAADIDVPILPGIMPITRPNQVKRAIELSGTNVPERFRNLVDHFGTNPAAMEQAGIVYASDQIIDLISNGVKHIHVYSMNKPQVAEGILKNLSEILK